MDVIILICLVGISFSILSDLILMIGLVRLNCLKDFTGLLIFIQCFPQMLYDIHWFTLLGASEIPPLACKIMGSLVIGFYYMSWEYNIYLSLEVHLKIFELKIIKTSLRKKIYHGFAVFSTVVIFIVLMTSDQNALSGIGTCSIQKETRWEFFLLIPNLVLCPLCSYLVFSSYYKIRNNHKLRELYRPHCLIIIGFLASFGIPGVIDGISWNESVSSAVPEPLKIVILIKITIIIGSLSGVFFLAARCTQKGFTTSLIKAVFCYKIKDDKEDNSLLVINPYKVLFEKTDQVVRFI